MRARVLTVPYVVGREAIGMGAGPLALAPGVAGRLGDAPVQRVALGARFSNEAGAALDLNRRLAAAVADARGAGELPVVLTGNCHSQQAVTAGLGTEDLGLVWADCHGDFNTPETTTTGFFDGCALSMVVGHCWRALCDTVPGFEPLPDSRVLLVGARDLEVGERRRLDDSGVRTVAPGEIAELPGRLGELAESVDRLSLHIDLDVLDPSVGRANEYAVGPGLTAAELLDLVRAVLAARPAAAVTLSAYDPAFDPDGAVRDVALEVAGVVAERARPV